MFSTAYTILLLKKKDVFQSVLFNLFNKGFSPAPVIGSFYYVFAYLLYICSFVFVCVCARAHVWLWESILSYPVCPGDQT